MGWAEGDVIVSRQVWRGRVVAGFPAIVVKASDDWVVSYIPTGAEFGFVDGAYPGPTGQHPWHGRAGWEGHAMLSIVPTSGCVGVQHFWVGPDRQFACWYLNVQEPARATPIGFDGQDLELDIVVWPDGSWVVKDNDLLDQRVAEGRWTDEEASVIREIGARVVSEVLEPRDWWWDTRWAHWVPESRDELLRLPDGWADVPAPPFAGLCDLST